MISAGLTTHFIAHFTLFIALLLGGTLLVGRALRKLFKIPLVAGHIVGGIILGPSVLSVASWPIFQAPFAVTQTGATLYTLASADLFTFVVLLIAAAWTVAYLLWLAGYETDIKDMLAVGGTAVAAGILGAVVPIAMIVAAMLFVGGTGCDIASAMGLGIIFAATSVSIPVAMLVAQKKMNLRSSKATLGAAIIDDILAVILLSTFILLLQQGVFGTCALVDEHGHSSLVTSFVRMVVVFVLFFAVGLLITPRIANFINKKKQISLVAPFAFLMMLLYFAGAELIGGLAGITGAYFAGVFQRRVDVKHYAEKTLSPFMNAILVPLFLCSIGLQVNMRLLTLHDWLMVALLFAVALASKFVGVFVATGASNIFMSKATRWGLLESYLFGSSMVARGEVGLVVATILRSAEVINDAWYVIAVVVIVLTTLAAPILLSIGFARLGAALLGVPEFKTVQLGRFGAVGTVQVFNLLVAALEKDQHIGTTIVLVDGLSVVHVEKAKTEIIYDPQEGITLKGPAELVERLTQGVKKEVERDMSRLNGPENAA